VKNWVMVKRAKDVLAREVDSQSEDLISLTRELALKSRSLHEAKEKAERASQAKGQFLSLISHELNTPLTTLLLTLEMVGKAGVKIGNEKQFQRILDASQKLRELIEMLLDYVRTESGRMAVQMTDVNISNLAHEIVDELRPQTVSKHISLEEEIRDIDTQTIKTDPRLLKIILSNLVSNAIKYTKEGRVKLSLKSLKDKLLINVTDTGIGIAQENLAKIFEPFEQLRTSEGGRSTQGIGLGLTLVKEMVSALGGEIKVDSVPGKGSSFSVSLPI
jgi:signal transduction histidine kinase